MQGKPFVLDETVQPAPDMSGQNLEFEFVNTELWSGKSNTELLLEKLDRIIELVGEILEKSGKE